MDKKLALKLNGGRQVAGILRGFDPFMNLVVDETVEECRDGSKNNIGMVVSYLMNHSVFVAFQTFFFIGYPRQQHCHVRSIR